jgi:hypothetical protein
VVWPRAERALSLSRVPEKNSLRVFFRKGETRTLLFGKRRDFAERDLVALATPYWCCREYFGVRLSTSLTSIFFAGEFTILSMDFL